MTFKPAPKSAPRVKVAKPRKPRKPIKKVNTKRHTREWLRAYGSPERVNFVRWLRCVVQTFVCERNVGLRENAHIVTGGASRKADADKIVPLCNHHHFMLNCAGRDEFERRYSVDLTECARMTELSWLAFQEGKP